MSSNLQKVSIVLVAVMLVGIVLAGMVFVQAFQAWAVATRAGNEAATIQNLKTVAVVASQYFYGHHRTFGTVQQLVREQMLSSKFNGNPIDGHVLTLTVTSEPAAYTLAADPASKSQGTNHFYLDSSAHQTHFNPDKPAVANNRSSKNRFGGCTSL
jgi:hypothetical protein